MGPGSRQTSPLQTPQFFSSPFRYERSPDRPGPPLLVHTGRRSQAPPLSPAAYNTSENGEQPHMKCIHESARTAYCINTDVNTESVAIHPSNSAAALIAQLEAEGVIRLRPASRTVVEEYLVLTAEASEGQTDENRTFSGRSVLQIRRKGMLYRYSRSTVDVPDVSIGSNVIATQNTLRPSLR